MKNASNGRPARGPDLPGLRAFVHRDDRLPPPAFVGREEIIADIERAVEEASAGGAEVKGRTRLVFGAPGAGKTALLDELARRWRERHAQGDAGAPIPVECEPDELSSPAVFTEAILSAAVPGRPIDEAESRTSEGGGGVPGVARVGISRTTTVPSLVDSVHSGRRSPWAAIREAAPPRGLVRPVVLLVDEAQNIPGDRSESGPSRLLSELHGGRHGLPVVAVLGGLGDSKQVAAARGIPRFARGAAHSLPSLSPDESEGAVWLFLTRHGLDVDGEAGALWVRRIAEASDGWPQHLHNYLRGTALALVDAGGDLERADLDDALAYGDEARREYYEDRLDTLNDDLPAVAAVVGRVLGSGVRPHRIALWCQEVMGSRADGDDLYRRMVHNGVVQEMSGGRVACPIPSFRLHILSRGAAPADPGP